MTTMISLVKDAISQRKALRLRDRFEEAVCAHHAALRDEELMGIRLTWQRDKVRAAARYVEECRGEAMQ